MIKIEVLLTTADDGQAPRPVCIWRGPVLAVPRVDEHFFLHKPPIGEPAADKYAGHYRVTRVIHLLAYKPRADIPAIYVHVEREPA
jgi:hypothetical protein